MDCWKCILTPRTVKPLKPLRFIQVLNMCHKLSQIVLCHFMSGEYISVETKESQAIEEEAAWEIIMIKERYAMAYEAGKQNEYLWVAQPNNGSSTFLSSHTTKFYQQLGKVTSNLYRTDWVLKKKPQVFHMLLSYLAFNFSAVAILATCETIAATEPTMTAVTSSHTISDAS